MIKKVLFCSSEVTPYAKTGGLADVSGALPSALRKQGIDCDVVMPLYRHIRERKLDLRPVKTIFFPLGSGIAQADIFRHEHVYFVANDEHFGRDGLYSYAAKDFPDNLERYAFFARACVELVEFLGAEVVHCNDWQTALIPAYLREQYLLDVVSVYTIHNLAYQGIFDASLWPLIFLPRDYFNPGCMEYYGNINVMKAGIVLADAVNTVSATYAREIQTPECGVGLDGLLNSVAYKLDGIVNGIDLQEWNPANDPAIAAAFDRNDLTGKALCKADLQKRFGLDADPDIPLFGLIGRLVDQKGIDMVLEAAPALLEKPAQLAVLGTGAPEYEERLRGLQHGFSGRCGVYIGFDEALAHVIEAGSDFFLMPSRFEPCGLNQMISMRYGTLPVVTAVGGLVDTVTALGEGDSPYGFRVHGMGGAALLEALKQACLLYQNQPDQIRAMQLAAMNKDVSWDIPARQYLDMYNKQKGYKESYNF